MNRQHLRSFIDIHFVKSGEVLWTAVIDQLNDIAIPVNFSRLLRFRLNQHDPRIALRPCARTLQERRRETGIELLNLEPISLGHDEIGVASPDLSNDCFGRLLEGVDRTPPVKNHGVAVKRLSPTLTR